MRIKQAIATICTAALLSAAPPASAWQAQSNTVAKDTKAGQKKKKCRWIETTGTNRAERICLTAEEWRQVDEYVEKQSQ